MDSIKDWINLNTEQLLKQQDLKEYLNKQIKQREEIEDEMLGEGDRLTELMIEKERMEFEMLDLDEQEDEGRRMELEAELEDIVIESESIT